MATVRVYDPVTNEPFDVPEHKATELRLQHGWLSHEFEVVKVAAVEVYKEIKETAEEVVEAVEEEIDEIVEAVEKIGRNKK